MKRHLSNVVGLHPKHFSFKIGLLRHFLSKTAAASPAMALLLLASLCQEETLKDLGNLLQIKPQPDWIKAILIHFAGIPLLFDDNTHVGWCGGIPLLNYLLGWPTSSTSISTANKACRSHWTDNYLGQFPLDLLSLEHIQNFKTPRSTQRALRSSWVRHLPSLKLTVCRWK